MSETEHLRVDGQRLWDSIMAIAEIGPGQGAMTKALARLAGTHGQQHRIEITLKGCDIQITPNMTADFTANTDFAQVEEDQQEINLTRFSSLASAIASRRAGSSITTKSSSSRSGLEGITACSRS